MPADARPVTNDFNHAVRLPNHLPDIDESTSPDRSSSDDTKVTPAPASEQNHRWIGGHTRIERHIGANIYDDVEDISVVSEETPNLAALVR
jgi:hypothetical protein